MRTHGARGDLSAAPGVTRRLLPEPPLSLLAGPGRGSLRSVPAPRPAAAQPAQQGESSQLARSSAPRMQDVKSIKLN